jgi:formylmethanofuran dehydrogenase subunit C
MSKGQILVNSKSGTTKEVVLSGGILVLRGFYFDYIND